MKKVLFALVCICAVAFTGCKETTYSEETGALKGTYKGNFTILKTSDNTTTNKEGKIHFGQNALNMDNLMWEYVIELERLKAGRYESSEDSYTTEMIEAATALINISDYTDERIEKMKVTAEFEGSDVTLKVSYRAMLLGIETEVVVATFNGTKE